MNSSVATNKFADYHTSVHTILMEMGFTHEPDEHLTYAAFVADTDEEQCAESIAAELVKSKRKTE